MFVTAAGLFLSMCDLLKGISHWSPRALFHDGGPYHIETSPLICTVNQWTGFYMIGTSIIKKLKAMLKLSVPVAAV